MSSFLIADCHIGHVGMTKFTKEDGSKLRPWDTIEEHDQALIDNWNSVVNDQDLVYILGDATINNKHIHRLRELKGRKKLVMGNHDTGTIADYLEAGIESLHGSIELKKYSIILSHIPVHVGQIRRYTGGNIHGHLHSGRVLSGRQIKVAPSKYEPWGLSQPLLLVDVPDTRYLCVSCEHINFTPINLEKAIELIQEQQNV